MCSKPRELLMKAASLWSASPGSWESNTGDFPCGSVVKTLYFHRSGCEFDPWLRN